jgi:hypothetical protein
MSLFRIIVAAALLTATSGTVAFARSSYEQPRLGQVLSRFDRGGSAGRPWCLHDYVNDEVDCSYSSHSQCAATASGGLGECSMN